MKRIALVLLVLWSEIVSSQPFIYFDFVSHNEETSSWDSPNYYSLNRAKLITLSNYFQSQGITWNMQSDWTYLTNVIRQDSAYFNLTNNKNILRWMSEDKGVEMDPHGHETQYIYPDLVKLMDSIGLTESKIAGGSLYAEANGINLWTNMINGQYGVVFPDKFWQPDYLMGGGTPNHIADLKYYGFWNPKSETEYLVHEPANHLRHIGVGCELKIKDSTDLDEIASELNRLIQRISDGSYPANGFYVQTIFFEQGNLNNPDFYNLVLAVADTVNQLVQNSSAHWKTLKQAYTEWESSYQASVFQWECGQTLSISELENKNLIVYPNPSSGIVTLKNYSENSKLRIFSPEGKLIQEQNMVGEQSNLNLEEFPEGLYLFIIDDPKGIQIRTKLILN